MKIEQSWSQNGVQANSLHRFFDDADVLGLWSNAFGKSIDEIIALGSGAIETNQIEEGIGRLRKAIAH